MAGMTFFDDPPPFSQLAMGVKPKELCHPERSEGSLNYNKAILRCAQDDIKAS